MKRSFLCLSRLQGAYHLQEQIERAGGMVSTAVEVFQKRGDEIGLMATRDIPAFERLVSVPSSLCLMENTSTQTEAEASKKLMETLLMRLKRMSEKGEEKVFSSFCNMLPTNDMMWKFPSQWNEDDWRLLNNTTLRHVQKKRLEQVEAIYESSYLRNDFNLSNFIWADDIVSSRSFGQGGYKSLVPFLDLVNHSDMVNQHPLGTHGCIVVRGPSIHATDAYHMFSLANICGGEELCISYGELSHLMALIGYGFIPSNDDSVVAECAQDEMGQVFHLSLPIVPKLSRRGRMSYKYELFEFNDKCIDETIEELMRIGISRSVLTRAVQRRIHQVSVALTDIEKQENKHDDDLFSAKEEIVKTELADLHRLKKFLESYDSFLARKDAVIKNRYFERSAQYNRIVAYANLFHESTGINIENELIDADLT